MKGSPTEREVKRKTEGLTDRMGGKTEITGSLTQHRFGVRQDGAYLSTKPTRRCCCLLLTKEFELMVQLDHPNIVKAYSL